jgi:tetratricopeptide (TPR) repeat protein
VLLERYQIVRELGSGAMGQVSLALDKERNQLVAVKRLHELIAVQGGARMRREFRSLSQIQHENVVKVFDHGEENGIPYLVMEFVRGQDLSQWLEGVVVTEDGQTSRVVKPGFAQIARVFAGIAAALGAVHAQGVIHRDLKPDNVRVTQDGEAKLMDFGLAKTLEGSVALTRAGAMVGTALYMAPEQCRGQQIDYRADLYAFGAVLYQALTGRVPFPGDSIVAVVMQHIQQAPQSPRAIRPEIPESLERLCLALLAKNPGDRPSSALAVREALLLASTQDSLPISQAVQPARADALLIAPLIGRDAELHALDEFVRTPAFTGWVALTGDVGTGKTRLLRTLGERVQAEGSRLVIGEAIPDDPTPLGTISRFIVSLEKVQRSLLDELSQAARGELSRIASGLGDAFGEVPPDPGLPPEVARLKLFEAITELLALVSRRGVAVFENLHWADESTLAALAHALRAGRVRLIASYRLEDLPEGSNTPKGFTRARQTIHLGALSEHDTRSILRALLDGEIELALEAELLSSALGNPWVLEERLKAMLESGAIQRRAGMYEWNRQRSKLPDSLGDLLKHRVQQLEGAALEFARAACVLGRAFRFEDARALLDWTDDLALEALESLLRARVIAETPSSNGEGFRFTHPLYAEILREGLMSLKRRRLHARAAQLLEKTAEPLELAEHHLASENSASALEAALVAGARAQAAFAYPQAERAYRIALESISKLETLNTASEDQQRQGLRARALLGEVLSFVGRTAEASEHWLYVIEHAQWLPDTAEITARAKVHLVRNQRLSGALEAAQSLLGDPKPDEPFYEDICIELCALYTIKGNLARGKHYGLEALRAAKRRGNLEGITKALMGLGLGGRTYARKTQLLRLSVKVAEQTGNNHLLARAWNDLGVALYGHASQEAFDAWKLAARLAERSGDIALLMRLQINTALVAMQDLEFDEAERLLENAMNLAERIGENAALKNVRYNLGMCRYARNRLSEARAHFDEVRDHPLEADARLWTRRITLELGDSFVSDLPSGGDDGMRRLLEAQLALSFGDYRKAHDLTAQPNASSDWHWALARVHAGWRLGADFQDALAQLLNLESLQDPVLSPDLARQYTKFVMLAVTTSNWDDAVQTRLRRSLEPLLASPVGQLARDVAFMLQTPKTH